MAERLREVAHERAGGRVGLFGEQTQRAGASAQGVVELLGLLDSACMVRLSISQKLQWNTQPGNRSVDTDQGSRRAVSDQPVIFRGQVTVDPAYRPKRWVGIVHHTSSTAHAAKRRINRAGSAPPGSTASWPDVRFPRGPIPPNGTWSKPLAIYQPLAHLPAIVTTTRPAQPTPAPTTQPRPCSSGCRLTRPRSQTGSVGEGTARTSAAGCFARVPAGMRAQVGPRR